jgi:hypothetical protein
MYKEVRTTQGAEMNIDNKEAIQQALEAATNLLNVLDEYHDQLVPINRKSATVRTLRSALDALNAEQIQNQPLQEKYNELLYQVSTKHPGETRHETALRYIRQVEQSTNQYVGQENKQ